MKQNTGKKLLGFLLTLALALGLMAGLSVTAYAATDTYTQLKNSKTVVKFNNHDWYIIADDSTATGGTVTLLAADTSFGTSLFDSTSPYSNAYSSSTVKGVLDALTAEEGAFASVKDVIADTNLSDVNVTGAKLYLLSTSEAGPYANFKFTGAEYDGWWLRSSGDAVTKAAFVSGQNSTVYGNGHFVTKELGVRPALKLDLSKVTFDSTSKTFSLPTPYPLWVGGVQVTSANASNITGSDPVTASYDADTKTLSLNGYNNNGQGKIDEDMVTAGSGIYAEGIDLTIHLTGVNTVTGPGSDMCYGICVDGNGKGLTIEGEGTLTAAASSGGMDNYGIAPGYQGAVIINAELIATGSTSALQGNVKNSIPGTGWNNVEGTGDGTEIAVSETGRSLSYQKVHFFSHTHAFTYTDNDGDTITATCANTDGKCTLDDGNGNHTATLTIAAPTTGNNATVTVSPAGAITGYTVKYQTKSGASWGAETTTAPSTAGIHRASITLTGTDSIAATASVSYGNNCITYATGLTNGSVSGDTGATCGATISPTITPDTGYELDTLTVTPEAGSGISATDITVDGGTFVMPEANVTVSATFKKINSAITLTQPAAGGTVTARMNDVDVTTAEYGDTITLGNTPADGYNFTSYSVTKTDDSTTVVTVTDGAFTMPAYPVTVTATFTPIDYTVTVSATTNGTVNPNKTTGAHVDDEITLTITPDTGYQLDTLAVVDADEHAVTVTNDKFTMPASNVTVNATFRANIYTVTPDGGKATVTDDMPTPNTYTAELINMPADKTYDGESVDLTDVAVQKSAGFPAQVTVGAVTVKDQNDNAVTAATNVGAYTATATVGDKTISKVFTIHGQTPSVTYVESTTRVGNSYVFSLVTTDQYIPLVSNPNGITLMKDGRTYVARGNIEIGALVYTGDVKLILCKDTTVTIYAGIYHIGSSLEIYNEQGAEKSQIIVKGSKSIDSLDNYSDFSSQTISDQNAALSGTINVHGGKLTVEQGNSNLVSNDISLTLGEGMNADGLTGGTENGDGSVTYHYAELAALNRLDLEYKLTATVQTTPATTVLPFSNTAQPLVVGGAVEGGTLEYALGTDATNAPASGWSTSVPTGSEPGTYYVWYRVEGDENHNSTAPACIVVTIEKPYNPAENADFTLLATLKTSGKKALKLSWTAVEGAEGYDIFFGRSSASAAPYLTSVNGNEYTVKKLKNGRGYRANVQAWRTVNGNKVYIGQPSPDAFAITGGKTKKFTNPKKITVNKKKRNVTLAAGKTAKIKAKVTKVASGKRFLKQVAKIRYFSSDRRVATVDAKGNITAVGAGACKVFAVAANGLRVGVNVTVK